MFHFADAAVKPKMPGGLNEQTSCANIIVQNVTDNKKVHKQSLK